MGPKNTKCLGKRNAKACRPTVDSNVKHATHLITAQRYGGGGGGGRGSSVGRACDSW